MSIARRNRDMASPHLWRLLPVLLLAVLALWLCGAARPAQALAETASGPVITVTDLGLPRSNRIVCALPTGTMPWAAFGGTSFKNSDFGTPDHVTISWSASAGAGGFLLEVFADQVRMDSIRLAASCRSYTWSAHAPYGGPYTNSHLRLSLVSDPSIFVDSTSFCLEPWGATLASFKGLGSRSWKSASG